MSNDPFADLSDTYQARKQRDTHARTERRKQRWKAAGMSLGATILVAAATSIGGAGFGWVVELNADLALDRFLGGIVCGVVGGVFLLFFALWRVMRRVVVNEVVGDEENIDVAATLFWATVAGAILFGSIGTALGFMGRVGWRFDVFGCAVVAGALALIPSVMLKNAARRTSRTRPDTATYRERE